ncbi:MAG: UDP-N-acetylmuramate dehydrogenase [Nitrospirae bacterium]|nr:UDP-N-acetylmuramate dehydrogenase [Nitrospirota bacterium]
MSLNAETRAVLKETLKSDVEFEASMAKCTTLRVGGPVDAMVHPRSIDQVQWLLSFCKARGVPYWVKGRGSNMLVLSKGIEGVLIDFTEGMSKIKRLAGNQVYAESGANITKLLDFCRKEGLGGVEFITGTPGTVGGALFMNAGANQGEMKDIVREVTLVNGTGTVARKRREEIGFRYRASGLAPGTVVLGVTFSLTPRKPEEIRSTINQLIKERRAKEPKGHPSAGSIFKNPPGDYAGRLIEACGLKGTRLGGAMVSREHANFIVTTGDASGDDVLALIRDIRGTVKEKTGILLEPEVQIVGRPERQDLEGFMEELSRERKT